MGEGECRGKGGDDVLHPVWGVKASPSPAAPSPHARRGFTVPSGQSSQTPYRCPDLHLAWLYRDGSQIQAVPLGGSSWNQLVTDTCCVQSRLHSPGVGRGRRPGSGREQACSSSAAACCFWAPGAWSSQRSGMGKHLYVPEAGPSYHVSASQSPGRQRRPPCSTGGRGQLVREHGSADPIPGPALRPSQPSRGLRRRSLPNSCATNLLLGDKSRSRVPTLDRRVSSRGEVLFLIDSVLEQLGWKRVLFIHLRGRPYPSQPSH